ncbi:hypothetical protein MTR_6g088585 [Medicago truncatula]|uniref:Uncharacterized protein n=1 Tax=Medicago truncatula TaxID=3880 RepID=A0A072UCJ7_MEDTR|nr:hypothetical protein MTR_6g088585 [Medicago truncatula]
MNRLSTTTATAGPSNKSGKVQRTKLFVLFLVLSPTSDSQENMNENGNGYYA